MIDKLKNRFVTGAWLTDVKHYFSKINEIVDWINNIGTPKYKVYSALLTQTGEDPPVATVLENTLGTINITRDGAGAYHAISNNLFIEGKTFGFVGSSINAYGIVISYQRASDFDFSFNTLDLDDILNQTPIEIRVYN